MGPRAQPAPEETHVQRGDNRSMSIGQRRVGRWALCGLGVLMLFSPSCASSPGDPSPEHAALAGFSPGGSFAALSDTDLEREVRAMASTGATWIRLDLNWPAIEPERATWDWAATDRMVAAAQAQGLRVVALPAYTPSWARPEGTSDKYPPTDVSDFGRFVGEATRRYAPRGVHTWEIWNEPNASWFWAPRPDAAAYTALLVAAAEAVRAADDEATVITGGLAPGEDSGDGSLIDPATFLRQVYAAGGGGAFDAVAVHPYCYPASPLDRSTSDWNAFIRLPEVHEVLASEGDGDRRVWLTEYGAPTGSGEGAVDEARQATLIRDGVVAARRWQWVGPLFVYSYRDSSEDPTDREANFGLVRRDFSPKPAWDAYRSAVVGAR